MPKPGDWHNHKVDPPRDDNEFFERMSRVIFMSGLNWATLEKKWPGIKDAFAGLDIAKVANFGEADIDRLMQNPAVIRNRPKIQAVINNARQFQAVIDEHSSFGAYLKALRAEGGEDALRAGVSKRFAFMGKGTTVLFLFSVGEDLPEAIKEFEARHKS